VILTVGIALAWTSPGFSTSCPAAFLIDLSCSACLGDADVADMARAGVGAGCRPWGQAAARPLADVLAAALWFGGGTATAFLALGRSDIGSAVPDPTGHRSCKRCPVALWAADPIWFRLCRLGAYCSSP